jgi:hypothetical protein
MVSRSPGKNRTASIAPCRLSDTPRCVNEIRTGMPTDSCGQRIPSFTSSVPISARMCSGCSMPGTHTSHSCGPSLAFSTRRLSNSRSAPSSEMNWMPPPSGSVR